MNLVQCALCNWSYPEDIVYPFVENNKIIGKACGICALERINKVQNLSRTSFTKGTSAENNRRRAIKWRVKHNELAPSINSNTGEGSEVYIGGAIHKKGDKNEN